MKDVNYKQIKQVTNLPKYDLGKINTNGAGFQQDLGTTIQGTVNDSGADLSGMASGERNARVAGITSNALKLGTGLISKVPTAAAIEASKSGLISQGTGALGKASGAMKSIAGMGIVTGLLDAGMGTMDVINSKKQMNNAFSGNEIQSWTGSQTGYGIGNNPYEQKTLDAANATNVINQRLKTANTGLATGSASLGSGLGTAVGSSLALAGVGAGTATGAWLGPIGALGGALIGGLTGWLVGGKRRREQERAAQDELARQEVGISNFNTQSLSEANSLGMRQEYETKHNRLVGNSGLATAKLGMQPGTILKGSNKSQYVNTAYGVQYRKPNAITNGNELIIDTTTGAFSNVQGDGKENKATFVRPEDAIINAHYADAARYAIATGNKGLLNDIINQQGIDMNRINKGLMVRYTMGKMPKYKKGKYSNGLELNEIKGIAPKIGITDPGIKKIDLSNPSYLPITDKWGNEYEYVSGDKPFYQTQSTPYTTSNSEGSYQDYVPYAINAMKLFGNMGFVLPEYLRAKKETARQQNPHVDDGAAAMYAEKAKPVRDYSYIPLLNRQLRHGLYDIKHNGSMGAGAKNLAISGLFNGMFNALQNGATQSALNFANQNNTYANTLGGFMANNGARSDSGRQIMNESSNRQISSNNNRLATLLNTMSSSWDTSLNTNNDIYLGNKTIGVYNANVHNDYKKMKGGLA